MSQLRNSSDFQGARVLGPSWGTLVGLECPFHAKWWFRDPERRALGPPRAPRKRSWDLSPHACLLRTAVLSAVSVHEGGRAHRTLNLGAPS